MKGAEYGVPAVVGLIFFNLINLASNYVGIKKTCDLRLVSDRPDMYDSRVCSAQGFSHSSWAMAVVQLLANLSYGSLHFV